MTSPRLIVYRDCRPDDLEVLWGFLAIAGYEPSAAAAKAVPVVAAHLEGWPRPGDFGVIAEQAGIPIGAAWARQFSPADNPVYYAGARIPEISIGVMAEARCQGVGLGLLQRLQERARRLGLDGLCLNVRDTNPAIRLYERAGYRQMKGAAVKNRVGGLSLRMLLRFHEVDKAP